MGKKVVGHKTHFDGTHEPLYEDEAEAIWAKAKADDAKRREQMPDSMAAIETLWDAHQRLRDEGWREGIYCPKGGDTFAVIQFGSTGIFPANYHGEWPSGHLICCDCVQHPEGCLWKAIDELTEAEKARLDKCADEARQMMESDLAVFSSLAGGQD